MDEQDRTPWFPENVKPARVGVYERLYPECQEVYYARWDGKYWRTFWSTSMSAAQPHRGISGYQALPWRGLAKEPK